MADLSAADQRALSELRRVLPANYVLLMDSIQERAAAAPGVVSVGAIVRQQLAARMAEDGVALPEFLTGKVRPRA